MEYISKDDAVGLSYWHGSPCTAENPYPNGTDAVDVSDINSMQTVDIVFCKDCKNRYTDDCPMYIEVQIDWENDQTEDDNFCKYGEPTQN